MEKRMKVAAVFKKRTERNDQKLDGSGRRPEELGGNHRNYSERKGIYMVATKVTVVTTARVVDQTGRKVASPSRGEILTATRDGVILKSV